VVLVNVSYIHTHQLSKLFSHYIIINLAGAN